MRRVALVIALIVAYASAHAVSIVPPAWNPNPSTNSPCGAGTASNTPVLTLTQGKTSSITWQVVAADGAGPITVTLDPAGTQNFQTTNQLTVTGATPTGVGTYQFTVATPSTATCSGPGNTCTMQLKTSANTWFSCATVAISGPNTGNATAAPTLPPNCVPAVGLTFCDWMNGQNVYLPPGVLSPIALDWSVKSAYNQYLGNPLVFNTPGSSTCQGWFKKFICGKNFQPCGAAYGTGGCNQACLNTNAFCGIDPSHTTLYNCTQFPNTGVDLTGNCSGAGSIQVSALVMIASALLMFIAFL